LNNNNTSLENWRGDDGASNPGEPIQQSVNTIDHDILTDEQIVALKLKHVERQLEINTQLAARRGDLVFNEEILRDGLLKDTVLKLLPHTQASIENLVFAVMTIFGNIVGRKPFSSNGEDEQNSLRANLWLIVVGPTAMAKKTQGLNKALELFKKIDPQYIEDCVDNGQGIRTGAGLLGMLDDSARPLHDRRLLINEQEWTKTMKDLVSPSNPLEQDMVNVKDSGSANKKIHQEGASSKVTEAHVSMIGNITDDSLKADKGRPLQQLINDGFMNRMLHVKTLMRTNLTGLKMIDWNRNEWQDIIHRWRNTIAIAEDIGEIKLTAQAEVVQQDIADDDTLGSLGSDMNSNVQLLQARSGYLSRQLQIVLALLDGSNEISVQHVRVSNDLLNYHNKSIAGIYSNVRSSNSSLTNTERIQEQFLASPDGRLTKTQLHNSHTKNKKMTSEELTKSLQELNDKKFIVFDPETRMRNNASAGNKRTEAYILLSVLEAKEKEEDGI